MAAVIFSDRFFPVTESVGILRVEPAVAAKAYAEWMTEIRQPSQYSPLQGGLADLMPSLEPLTVSPTRVLLAGGPEGQWTAFWDNAFSGTEPRSALAVLTRRLNVEGLCVSYSPDSLSSDGERLGGCYFAYTKPGVNDHPGVSRPARHIYLWRQEGSKWHFETRGAPLEFEALEAYTRRRKRDRFTKEMLADYCRSMGVDVFDPDYFSGDKYLVSIHNRCALPDSPKSTFAERQRQRRIVPGQ